MATMVKSKSSSTMLSSPWLIGMIISVFIRLVLFSLNFDQVFERMIEFSTPTTSFKRFSEGLHLLTLRLSPYSSTMFLQPPLLLLPFLPVYLTQSHAYFIWYTRILYIALDLLITYLLFNIAKVHQQQKVNTTKEDNVTFQKNLPHVIAALYLFNPVMIMSNVSLSTVIFNNAALAATVYFAMQGYLLYSTLFVAIATYLTVYPVILFVPISLMIAKSEKRSVLFTGLKVIIMIAFWTALLLFLSYSMMGDSWVFIENAYIYPLGVNDLTPNWSNFWYMFTEVFDHFNKFFLLVFHVHILAYIVPLTIRFK
jgi:phosphatidylinositol glycan class U